MRVATLIAALAVVFFASTAHADGDPRLLAERAKTAFDAGDFMTAAKLLEDAYATKPWPVLLYNLGRAYQQAGSKARAIDAYERYLAREPGSPDAGAVRESIRQLKEQIDRDQELERAAQSATERSTRAAEEANRARAAAQEANERARHKPSALPWITTGVGLGGVSAGIVFAVLATSRHTSAVSDPSAAQALQDQSLAQSFAIAANVLFIAGGAVALIGGVWGVFDLRLALGHHAQVGISPTALVFRGAF